MYHDGVVLVMFFCFDCLSRLRDGNVLHHGVNRKHKLTCYQLGTLARLAKLMNQRLLCLPAPSLYPHTGVTLLQRNPFLGGNILDLLVYSIRVTICSIIISAQNRPSSISGRNR
jgi:hypothetical protein